MGGLIKGLFGGAEQAAAPAQPAPPGEDVGAALMRLTRTYWARDPAELARLRPELDSLPWPKLFRLHHLACLEVINGGAADLQVRTAARLASAESPYLPRAAAVIQRPRGTVQLPLRQGELRNASASHSGALEVIKLNKDNHPVALDFIGFKTLSRVSVGPPSLFPPANLQHADGRTEVVCLPLLYGPSWSSSEPTDQDGSMTRFLGHHPQVTQGGIGMGHQDFMCGGVMFGLGSVQQFDF